MFLSPGVDEHGMTPHVHYNVSFAMDAVQSVRQIFASFTLLPNPRLSPFNNDRKEYRGEILSLEVSELVGNMALRSRDAALEICHSVQTSAAVTLRYVYVV